MNGLISLLLLAIFVASSHAANYVKCFPGNYCDLTNLVTQAGTFKNPQQCADKCARTAGNKYFSYVPSSQQCLCNTGCDNLSPNPNVDSYCMTPIYHRCWTDSYCGPNAQITTLPGIHTPDTCSAACLNANSNYKFFNLVVNGQCQCNSGCNQLIASNGVSAYALNGQTCAVTKGGALRA